MNTANDEACSHSKNAVTDCKFTSRDFFACFLYGRRYRLFGSSSNTSAAMIASRSAELSGARLIAKAFRLGSSGNSISRSAGKSDKLSRPHGWRSPANPLGHDPAFTGEALGASAF